MKDKNKKEKEAQARLERQSIEGGVQCPAWLRGGPKVRLYIVLFVDFLVSSVLFCVDFVLKPLMLNGRSKIQFSNSTTVDTPIRSTLSQRLKS